MRVATISEHFADLSGHRVLVVEDESLVAMMIEDTLVDAGAEVVGTAATIDEAIAMIEVSMADGGLTSAVLDLNLNGKSALPVADRLMSLNVPFVIATGYGADCDIGRQTYVPLLQKPFSLERLTSAVASIT